MSERPREASLKTAFASLVEEQGFRCPLDGENSPDEEKLKGRPRRSPKSPDLICVSEVDRTRVQVEFTALLRPSDEAAYRQIGLLDRLVSEAVPSGLGTFQIDLVNPTIPWVKRLIRSGRLRVLIEEASKLPVDPLISALTAGHGVVDAAMLARFAREAEKYRIGDQTGRVWVSKISSDDGLRHVVSSTRVGASAVPMSEDTKSGSRRDLSLQSVPLLPRKENERLLLKILGEAEEKFGWLADAEGVLVIDVHNYGYGPRIIADDLAKLDLPRFKRVHHVILAFDHPYTEPPLELGRLSGPHRFWSVYTHSGSVLPRF